MSAPAAPPEAPPLPPPDEHRLGRRPARSRIADPLFRIFLTALAALVLVILAVLIGRTTWTALPFLEADGKTFLTSSNWDPSHGVYGALGFVFGTIVTAILALLIAVPVSVGTAVWLVEIAPRRLRRPVSTLVELLAAVPSVVYGLWGIAVLAPFLQLHLWTPLSENFGWIPLFAGPVYIPSIATAGVVLAIMVIPIVTAISRESISLVPFSQREGAMGLGATRWETIRHAVVPYAKSGIVGSIVLGLGRAMGETIAVAFVIGGTSYVGASILHPGATMASVIATDFPEATGVHIEALVAIGVLLFVITISVNLVAQLIVRRSVKVLQ